jgi:hypothetical protein
MRTRESIFKFHEDCQTLLEGMVQVYDFNEHRHLDGSWVADEICLRYDANTTSGFQARYSGGGGQKDLNIVGVGSNVVTVSGIPLYHWHSPHASLTHYYTASFNLNTHEVNIVSVQPAGLSPSVLSCCNHFGSSSA